MIDENINKHIIEYIRQGLTIGNISKLLKISRIYIRNYLTKLEQSGIDIINSDISDVDINSNKVTDTNKNSDTDLLDETNKKILELNQSGLRMIRIAEKLNLNPSTISKRVKKMQEKGIAFSDNSNTKQRDEQILKLRTEGLSVTKIAKELNISHTLIYTTIKKMQDSGIDIPVTSKFNEIDRLILQMSKEGLNQSEISKEIGLSKQAISQRIRKMKKYNVNVVKTEKKEDEKTKKENTQILNLMAKGITKTEIAKRLGVNISVIHTRIMKMKKVGIEFPQVPIKRQKEIDEIDKEILKLRQQGLTIQEIASKLNFSTQRSIYNRLKKIKEIEDSKRDRIFDETATHVNLNKKQLEKAILNLAKSKNATFEQMQRIAQDYDINLDKTLYSMDMEER